MAATAAAAMLPDWVRPAPVLKAADDFQEKLKPQVTQRPAVLLETDYYVYPWSGGNTPTVVATIDGNSYNEPVTMFLYWQNRVTGQRRAIRQGDPDRIGLGDQVTDGENQTVLADNDTAAGAFGAQHLGGVAVIGDIGAHSDDRGQNRHLVKAA